MIEVIITKLEWPVKDDTPWLYQRGTQRVKSAKAERSNTGYNRNDYQLWIYPKKGYHTPNIFCEDFYD